MLLLSHCSIKCLFKIAKVLGFIVAHTGNRLAKQTQQNIDLCFAKASPERKKVLYSESITHTCCSLIELAAIWHQPIEQVLDNVQLDQNCDDFKNDTKAKIVIAPHHGSWELLNLWLADAVPLYALYKPAKNQNLDQYILNKRTRNGATLSSVNTAGLRSLLKGLKNHSTAMILPDQKPTGKSAKVKAHFYGHEAPTTLLIKNLASKIDCNIYIAAMTRDLKHGSFCLKIKPLDKQIITAPDQQSAEYLNQSIEDLIADDETQYQWSYKRFTSKIYQPINLEKN